MANHKVIVPFILESEGGWSINKGDKGGETNKGITYKVWCSVFGENAHDRFMKMAPEDWARVYKPLYWDAILGDLINSQKISNLIVDWVWGSGKFYPEKHIQHVLNGISARNLTEDGNFGPATIEAINSTDEETEYNAIIKDHFAYIDNLCRIDPTQEKWRQGWINRADNLIIFNKSI